jgi:acyl dehydratase
MIRGAFSSGPHETSAGLEVLKAAVVLSREGAVDYARASEDLDPRYFQEGEVFVNPLYASALLRDVLEHPIVHPKVGINLLKMVHAEQTFRFVKPLRVGMELESWSRIAGFRRISTGILMDIDVALREGGGETVVEGTSVMFSRVKSGKGGSDGAHRKPQEESVPAWEEIGRFAVNPDQPGRYALASGDYNPIHRVGWVARLSGFKGPVAHGLCVMSMAAGRLIQCFAEGNSERLLEISLRFARPAYPGDELILKAAEGVEGIQFVLQDALGRDVLKNGVVKFRPSVR